MDEPPRLCAVEDDGRGLAVLEGAEPDERWLSGGAHVRAVLVGIDNERRAELCRDCGEGPARVRALLQRSRVVAEEEVDLAPAGEALQDGPLARGGPMPVAAGSRRPGAERAAVGEAAQAAEKEACSGRQVMQAEPKRHRPRGVYVGAGAGECLGVVVVSLHEQKLEIGATEQRPGEPEEAAAYGVARQVAEIAEGDERVTALIDGALDQVAQVPSVAMHIAEDEQPAHSTRLPPRVTLVSDAWARLAPCTFLCRPPTSGELLRLRRRARQLVSDGRAKRFELQREIKLLVESFGRLHQREEILGRRKAAGQPDRQGVNARLDETSMSATNDSHGSSIAIARSATAT